MIFEYREQAGAILAEKLKKYGKTCLVLAIPRGGVVVGAEIAKKLSCPLDVIITRKIGAPGNPELAIGATTSKGGLVLDRELIDKLEITQNYLHAEHKNQLAEARRREKAYTKGKTLEMIGKTAILVDDGIATGSTMEAAIRAVREELPAKVVVAVPVAPPQTAERLRNLVDDFVVISTPDPFWAIGEFYKSFPQVSDEEVIRILEETNKAESKR
jgi:putative phosphoribosyl transferase